MTNFTTVPKVEFKDLAIPAIAILLPLLLSSPMAHAADRAFKCALGENQGTGELQVLHVENHPELLVLKLELKTKLARYNGQKPVGGEAHLSGLFAAQTSSKGRTFASGLVSSKLSGEVIVNPELVTLQGDIPPTGEFSLQIIDEDRVLQLGYGVELTCR
jgi:hypothetical protein